LCIIIHSGVAAKVISKQGIHLNSQLLSKENKMDFEQIISQMVNNAQRIRALAEGVSDEQARYKPDPESWSILEVVNHLLDIEKEDMGVFLDIILNRPGERRPKISPDAWVTERGYNQRDLGESLQDFIGARESSLTWLRSLASPDWETIYEAPWGPIKAGDIMTAWAAHDLLHMRQLVELHWAYTMLQIHPYDPGYAGDW
jgi:hypothetical protein